MVKLDYVKVHDNEGDGNGILNNGETAFIEVNFKNFGRQPFSELIGKLSSTDKYIRVMNATDKVSSIRADQDSSVIFKAILGLETPQFHFIEFQINLSSKEKYELEEIFQLNNVSGLFDNFEYESRDWVHASWKTTPNDHDDWQWGTPQGKAGDPSSAYSGTKCWGTDLGYDDYDVTSWDGYYQHNVLNYLKSPAFDCSGLTNVGLRFQRWLDILPGDIARIKVNYTTVWTSQPEEIHDSQWQEQLINISDLADNRKSVTIMFELQSNGEGWAGGWNIDDVLVTGDLVSSISQASSETVPDEFQLFDNYPNPFNPITKLAYTIPSNQHVELKIINVLGRKVNTLVFEDQEAGFHQIIWNGKDSNGNTISSGVYLYQLKVGECVQTKKLLFLK